MGAVVINYLAVVVAAIFSMVLGALWYSPVLFGKQWMKLSKVKMNAEMKKKAKFSYIGMFVGSIITALILSAVVDYANAATFLEGLLIGVLVWFGFVATTQIGAVLWEGKPKALFLLNTAFSLVNYAIVGGIVAVWV